MARSSPELLVCVMFFPMGAAEFLRSSLLNHTPRPVAALVSPFRVQEPSVKTIVSWGVSGNGGCHTGVGDVLLGLVKFHMWLWIFPDDITLGLKIFTSVALLIAFTSVVSLSLMVISLFDMSVRMRALSLKQRLGWLHPMICVVEHFMHLHFLEFLLWSGFLL